MKQKHCKRVSMAGIAVLLAIGLTGCQSDSGGSDSEALSLFEETEVTMPQYKMTEIKRGSKKEKQVVECVLKSEESQNLFFGVSNIPFKAVYVKENDFVKKGDLLAELELKDLDEKIKEFERNKELKEAELIHNSKLMEIEKQKALLVSDEKERIDIQDTMEDYKSTLALLEKEISNIEKQIESVESDREKCSLYAPMDGYVRNIMILNSDSVSDRKQAFASIFSQNLRFESINPVTKELKIGEKLAFTIDDQVYDAKVIGKETMPSGDKILLKVLTEQEFQTGTIGSFTLVGDSFVDSLYVKEKAVLLVDDKPAVIRLDELGFKNYVPVETGLRFNGVIQILSGVKEGDQVVLE